jgi:hypothetical protein
MAHFAVLVSHRLRRFSITKPQQGFTRVHPSDLSLTRRQRMARHRMGLSPLLPDLSVARDARRSREQVWTLTWIAGVSTSYHLHSATSCRDTYLLY